MSSVLSIWHSLVMQCIMQQPQVYSPLGANGLDFHTVVCNYICLTFYPIPCPFCSECTCCSHYWGNSGWCCGCRTVHLLGTLHMHYCLLLLLSQEEDPETHCHHCNHCNPNDLCATNYCDDRYQSVQYATDRTAGK